MLTGQSGIGQAYWQVLAGRAISGIGGAGMTALVSIIIAGEYRYTTISARIADVIRHGTRQKCSRLEKLRQRRRYRRKSTGGSSGRLVRRYDRMAMVLLRAVSVDHARTGSHSLEDPRQDDQSR